MIRPFDWRDLGLLHRVRSRGIVLAAQLACTRGPQALAGVILDAFSGGRSPATLVARSDGLAGLGQLLHRPGQPHARLAFLAPAEIVDAAVGTTLLEALSRSAGERGAHHLIAEVDEGSPVFERLRQIGFAIYARQRIWKLADRPKPPATAQGNSPWRPETASDLSSIRNLVQTLVPPLVQQVEPLAERSGAGLVHSPAEDILAYLEIERGPLGTWAQAYFHPAAESARALLEAFLAGLPEPQRRPLYMCVRSYQSWMNRSLQELRFEPVSDQAVMVKRLAVRVPEATLAAERRLAAARPEPTAPIQPANGAE
jgi:hypothetical protein